MAKPAITIPSSAMLVLFLMTSALAFSTREGDNMANLEAYGGRSEAKLYLPVGPVEHHQAEAGVTDGGSSALMAPPFQVCRLCQCCDGGSPAKCSMVPCCYALVCDIPGKRPGVCSLAPKACNCASCG